ncbi:MAG: dicarboxylate/amino acid:cation symporter [Pirellulaceae bacterium]|nr:dicarboxylate/amino acid:cation symporter [Pirellulaceae bacterium]
MFQTWNSIALWKRVLAGLVVGLVVGLCLRYSLPAERSSTIADVWLRPWGDGFVRLIQMLVVPLIFTTLVSGVAAMGDPKKLGSLGSQTIALYLLTTVFAVSLGLAMGNLLRPGVGVDYSSASQSDVENVQDTLKIAESAGGIAQRLLAIIPSNPVQSLAQADVLQIIFFALLVGLGIVLTGRPAEPAKLFFDAAAEVVMRITLMVMELAPLGVMALMAWVMASKGVGVLYNLFWLAAALYLACAFQILVVYGLLLIKLTARLPMLAFFRGIVDVQGVAYSTSSSNATLPVSISCAEKNLGIDKSIAGSVLPLGATINMDGTSCYLGLIALFAAQATGIELSWSQYLGVALTATAASIGTAGIPSASLLLAASVLSVVGITHEQALIVIAFIFPFDRLLDMMRTLTNVTGDMACASVVAKWNGGLDEDVFRSANDT